MATSSSSFDGIEIILVKWLNTLNICKRITNFKDFADGKIFLHLAEIIKGSNQVTPKSQDPSEESNDTLIISKRYDFVKSVLNEHFKLESAKIIDYEALVRSDNNEVAKLAILLLTAVVLFHIVHQMNKHILNPLFNLPPHIQTFIQDWLEIMLTIENEAQLHDSLSSVVENRGSTQSYESPARLPRKRTSSKELPPINSPLRELINSTDIKYKIALKDKKKEINYLKMRVQEKSEKAEEMRDTNNSLKTVISEKDKEIKELKNDIGFLTPFRELLESSEGQQLELKEKITFLEERFKRCPTCIEYLEKMNSMTEDQAKILAENANLKKEVDFLQNEHKNLKKNANDYAATIATMEKEHTKKINECHVQIEKLKFTSNLYQTMHQKLAASIRSKPNVTTPEGKTGSGGEDIKPKIGKTSPKLSPDKNVTKIKELQSTISGLNAEIKKYKKIEKDTRKEIDHITSQYGSSLDKERALQVEIDDLKAKLLDKEGSSCETSLISNLPKKRNSTPRTGSAKRKKSVSIQPKDEPVIDELPSSIVSDSKSQDSPQIHDKITSMMQKESEFLQRERETILKLQSEVENLQSYSNQLLTELQDLKQNCEKLKIEKEMSEKDMDVKTVILKENYDQMRQEKEECDVKLQQLEEIKSNLLVELDQYQRKSVEKENVEKQIIEQLSTQEKELESNKLVITELTERNSVLTNQFQELTKYKNEKEKNYCETIKELKNANNKLNSELEKINAKFNETEERSRQLSVDLDESKDKLNQLMKAKEECEQLSNKLTLLEKKNRELSVEIERLTANVNKVEVAKHSVLSELEQTRNKLSKAEGANEKSLAEIEKITAKLISLEKDKKEHSMKLEQLSSNKKKLIADITRLNTELESERSEKQQLIEELDELNPRLSQVENDKSQLLTELQHLRGNYKVVVEESRKLSQIIQEKDKEIEQVAVNKTKLQKELQTAESNYKSLQRKHSDCRSELEYTGLQLSELKKARDRQNRDIIRLEASKDSELNDLRKEKNQILKMYEDLRRNSTTEIDDLSSEIRILNIQIEQKDKACNHLEEVIAFKCDEITKYSEAKKELTQKNQDLEKALKLKKELADSEIGKLKDELKKQEDLLKGLEEKMIIKEEELNRLKTENEEELNQLKTTKEAELNQLKTTKEEELNQLKTAKEEELDQLKTAGSERINKISNEKDKIIKDLENLKADFEKKEKEMQEHREQMEIQHEEAIEKIVSETMTEMDKLLIENNKLKECLKELTSECQNKEKEIKDIKSQLAQQTENFEKKTKEAQNFENKIKKLTKKIKTVNNDLKNLNASLTNVCEEKNAEIKTIQQELKEKETKLQEWKSKAKENEVAKERFNLLMSVERRYKDARDLNERLHAKIEDLLNELTKVESEKENAVNKLTRENKNLARRIDTLKDSGKQKSERIQSLLKEIDDQKKFYDDDTQSFKDSMEEKFQRLKERDCLKKDRMVNLLKCDIESKEKEIFKLQRELKEFKKIAADSKEWVHRNALYKLRLSQHSKRLEIYKKILSRTSGANKKLKQELKDLLETEDECVDANTYTKILQQEAIAELEEQRADTLDADVKKLEKRLHFEEEKNKRLFMRLKATEYKLFMINREQDASSILMGKKSKETYQRLIYREGCSHKTRKDEELSDGPDDPDMPGHQYMILKLLKHHSKDDDSLGLKRKKFSPGFEDLENYDEYVNSREKRMKYFFDSPSSITYKLGMNTDSLPDDCTYKAAYSVEYLPSSTNEYSTEALKYGRVIKKKSNSKRILVKQKARNKTVKHPNFYFPSFDNKPELETPVPKPALHFLW